MTRNATKNYAGVKAWRARNQDKHREQNYRWRARNPKAYKAIKQRFRTRHLERVRIEDAERARAKRRNDPEGQRIRSARFKARKVAEQVAVAGRPPPDTCELCGEFHLRIVFDHCHQRGHFRGWLCDRCNKVLGIIKDDPGLLRKMADYLEQSYGDLSSTTAQASLEELRVTGQGNGTGR
jgi:hypothetical protein